MFIGGALTLLSSTCVGAMGLELSPSWQDAPSFRESETRLLPAEKKMYQITLDHDNSHRFSNFRQIKLLREHTPSTAPPEYSQHSISHTNNSNQALFRSIHQSTTKLTK